MKVHFGLWGAALLLGIAPVAALAQAAGGNARLHPVPAAILPAATQAMMLGAAWAGERVVAVGDHGAVLLSDDGGATYRQARSVPVSSLLTAVSFGDAQRGWAVGHWGAILVTQDGGETWQSQRLATDVDRPLFAVHFFDAEHGVAVGLWSLVLTTDDGGKTWVERALAPPPGAKRADLNLLSLFADGKGALYATAERGQLLRSDDRGLTWQYHDTGYRGSLWAGAVLPDGSLLVGGQRGTLMRAPEPAGPWQRVLLDDARGSVTGMAAAGARVVVVGLDGMRAVSEDGGASYHLAPLADGASLTAVLVAAAGGFLAFSKQGPRAGE